MSVLQFKRPELNAKSDEDGLRFYAEHKKKTTISGFDASYLDCGSGLPIVFLHGALYSSVSWRKAVSVLSEQYHCVAPDHLGVESRVIGSDNPRDYGFQAQRTYFDEFIEEKFPDQSVILVVQGSGTILGCDWAYRNQHRVKGIVHIAGFFSNAHDFDRSREIFSWVNRLNKCMCEDLDLVKSFFERWAGICFSDRELREYEKPFTDSTSRAIDNHLQLMLDEGGENAVFAQIVCNTSWLASTCIPKLMVGTQSANRLVSGAAQVARFFPNQQTVEYDGLYLVQEQRPEMFAQDIDLWIQRSIIN